MRDREEDELGQAYYRFICSAIVSFATREFNVCIHIGGDQKQNVCPYRSEQSKIFYVPTKMFRLVQIRLGC